MWKKIIDLKQKLSLRVFASVFFLLAFFLVIGSIYEWRKNNATTIQIATIVAGASAALSVFYLAEQIKVSAEQIKVSIEQEKIKRAYEYIKRYNSPEFEDIVSEAVSFIRNRQIPEEEKWAILFDKKNQKNREISSKIILSGNFFEELATFYNRNLLNKELVKTFFKAISIDFYSQAELYIQQKQDRDKDPLAWKEWEKMTREFKDSPKS